MKRFFQKNWPWLLIIALSVFVVWPLFKPGYFSHHDNLQVIRIFEMRRCFTDMQIPCRWVPDMGLGYGFPLFNYYGVFPYYIGAIVSYILGFIGSAKFLFLIPMILGGVSMYILAKEVFSKEVGFVSGILYLFAPYMALDVYVRGDVTESFSIAIVPIVFYFSLKLIRKSSLTNFLGLAISLGVFLTNHNIMTLVFMPVLFVWLVFWILHERKTKIWLLVISPLLGIGLASFYIIPAYFEKELVQIDNLKESVYIPNFRAHFVTVSQLFTSRFWGYGASTWGNKDGISFQVGWPHWWLAVGAGFVSVLGLIFYKKSSKKTIVQFRLVILMFLVFLYSVFMTHNKSAFIWEKIEILQFFQFPWRFLSLSIFSVSLIGGFIISFTKGYIRTILIAAIVILAVSLNFQFFRPEKFFSAFNDRYMLTGPEWDYQKQGSIVDYLPKNAKEPKEPAPETPLVLRGEAKISGFINKSDRWEFNASVTKDSVVEVPVFDFQNWKVKIGIKYIDHNSGSHGAITFDLPAGDYKVVGEFKNTPLRNLANGITVISLLSLVCFSKYAKSRKVFV
jgi:hypothetical protein